MSFFKEKPSEIIFQSVLTLILIIFCITTIYPFLHLLSISLTATSVSTSTIHLIPPKWDFGNYIAVFKSDDLGLGFKNTVIRVAMGTTMQLIVIVCTAYALSKKYFPNRGFWTGAIVFTMYFSGGLIPSYILVKNLHLFNSYFALILPGLIPTFTMLIVRNFFMAIPDSLEESARIDGANDILILFKIILPVSMPIIATVILWQMVGHWNAWFDAMIYIQDKRKQVLQIILRRVLLEGSDEVADFTGGAVAVRSESLKAAVIMIVIFPIICVYPFLQKYFVKGILIGSLKG